MLITFPRIVVSFMLLDITQAIVKANLYKTETNPESENENDYTLHGPG